MLGVVTAGLAFSASTTNPSPPKFAGDFYTGEQASVVLRSNYLLLRYSKLADTFQAECQLRISALTGAAYYRA